MTRPRRILVTKSTGEVQRFDEQKLRRSLRRSGARKSEVDRVVAVIYDKIGDEISTRQLFRFAFGQLRKSPPGCAARYSLHRSIMDLGPTGFPFERFVGAVFEQLGHSVEVGVHMQGQFVKHEIDIVTAGEAGVHYMECKFHSAKGTKSDIKVALYLYARSLDLRAHTEYDDFWLITNTRFTSDAERYGTGVGMKLCSWDYPKRGNLRQLIEESGLHPLTCMTTLRSAEKKQLLKQGIVLCRELSTRPQLLAPLKLSRTRQKKVHAEAQSIIARQDSCDSSD